MATLPGSEVPDGFDPKQMQQMQALLSMSNGMTGAMPPMMDSSAPGMPAMDPAMAGVYMQMMQYLQSGMGQPGLGAGGLGVPPMPFPGMTPYAPSMPMEPAVNVSVEGMKFQYQLTEDDLQKVFSRYGSVRQIRVDEAGSSAVIIFNSFPDAQAAMNDLNGKVLNGLEGMLRITWMGQPSVPPYPQVPFPGWGFPMGGSPAWPASPPGPPTSSPSSPTPDANNDRSPHTKGVRKYTCRFLIGIENDKEFQVARRIIGAKGSNMKRVVKGTDAKLRLRGMGSGYFEGAGQKESAEPLQLCVSCVNVEGYKSAVKQVEDLLKRVYEEYKQFCQEFGRPAPDLQIQLTENQLVYSSKSSLTLSPNSDSPGSPGDASPKREGRRGRRNRLKREGRTSTGEIDRGEPGPNAPTIEEIEKLIDDRNEARRANNFPEADRVRELLHSRGVALMDEPGGRGRGAEVTTWRYWRD